MANFLIKKKGSSEYGYTASGTGFMDLLIKPNSKNLSNKDLTSVLRVSHGDSNVQEVILIHKSSTWAYFLYIGDKDTPSTGIYQGQVPDIVFPSSRVYEMGNCILDRYYDICSFRCRIIDGEIDYSNRELLDLTYSVAGDINPSMNTQGLQVAELEDVRDWPDSNFGNYKLWVTTTDMVESQINPLAGSITLTQSGSNNQLIFSVLQRGYNDNTEITFNYESKEQYLSRLQSK